MFTLNGQHSRDTRWGNLSREVTFSALELAYPLQLLTLVIGTGAVEAEVQSSAFRLSIASQKHKLKLEL
jgi:hypothetical protein